jgi:uncharacterized membrane protein
LPAIPPSLPELPIESAIASASESAIETPFETRFGLGWLNRVAVITLLFGMAFLFKLAIDNEWIGPSGRVALGIAAAMLSFVLGEWFWLRGQKVFAQGLTGLGVALLYLSFYASFAIYHLLSQSVAFGFMFLTTLAAAGLALHYDSQVAAILGAIGGFLTPALLSTGEDHLGILGSYTLILSAGALGLARLKRWGALEYLAFAGTWLLFFGWSSNFLTNETRIPAFLWFTATFAVFFAASTLSYRLSLLTWNAGIYFAASYYVLDPRYHNAEGAVAAALAVLHGGAAWLVWTQHRRFAGLAATVAAVFLTLAIPLQFTSFRITMLWSLEGAALAWLAKQYGGRRFQLGAWILFAAVFLRLFVNDAQVFEIAFFNGRLLAFAVVAASLWIAARFALSPESESVTYGAGHFVLLWALAMEISGWAQRTAEVQDAANVASTGISILMAVYALVLVVAGVAMHSALNRILGLGLMALVIAKLYLFDIWQLSRGFRITAFLALGALLLLVSYLYSRFKPALEKLWKAPAVQDRSTDLNPSA